MYLVKLKFWNFRKYASKDGGEILNTWFKMRQPEIAEQMPIVYGKKPRYFKGDIRELMSIIIIKTHG